ncbi:MAG: GNAT family N-acetyltransferase [Candidatus Nitrotoga sp.]|jgi:GNAT superfamily N-acetyltransferase|nr:GNAT family N-acetyltransferase [Candidatus Nitrotoga sp.]MBP0116964.1 GNAT family N-acetyltransferase [Candidatus Nitrotoga sp.]MBP0123149.1 GNAT family N-acetyltransferase [Candidatus Nitrotoga sp.]MDW7535306.1 GNAT family N-acetyltransferase [Candidatus Nitrotoga sp.]MDW7604032.1 GNAT family N-acetyltransferase [Candidatus Nitrotoga sp.]
MDAASQKISIRFAEARDASVIAEFNLTMARETEQKELLPELVLTGVNRVLSDSSIGFYVIAERENEVVGSLMVTTEWSDWRNGTFWWIQSVYVRPCERRNGTYTRLYQFIREAGKGDPSVCGFRLYVDKGNALAKQAYQSLGMIETDYQVFEEMKSDFRFLASAVR